MNVYVNGECKFGLLECISGIEYNSNDNNSLMLPMLNSHLAFNLPALWKQSFLLMNSNIFWFQIPTREQWQCKQAKFSGVSCSESGCRFTHHCPMPHSYLTLLCWKRRSAHSRKKKRRARARWVHSLYLECRLLDKMFDNHTLIKALATVNVLCTVCMYLAKYYL